MSKVVVLPERDEMLKRLLVVDDDLHLQTNLYLLLLDLAGQRFDHEGIVLKILMAVKTYTQSLPPAMYQMVLDKVPHFIDVLVDDKEVAQAAKDYLATARKQ
jgi:hypothetical protein